MENAGRRPALPNLACFARQATQYESAGGASPALTKATSGGVNPPLRIQSGGLLSLGGAAGAGLFGAVAHFFAVAFEFAEGVDGLVLGFVVGTGDDLAQEAHGDELDAGDDQGAVLAHDGDAVGELFVQKVKGVEQAEENPGYADEAEELKRARRIVL